MFRHKAKLSLSLLSLLVPLLAGSARATPSALTIQSAAFAANSRIPVTYSCSGEDKSPELSWSGVPSATKSLALIVRDPDAPMGSYVHWVIYNLPASETGLAEGMPTAATLDGGAMQGVGSAGATGYHGPCPPPGAVHHYHFRLYALDIRLRLAAGADADEVEAALKGHVLASAELVGTFAR